MIEVVTFCTALRPIRELPLIDDVFTENIAELECGYIKDENVLISKDAIRRKDRVARLTQKVGFINEQHPSFERYTGKECEAIFYSVIARANKSAELIGCFESGQFGFINGCDKGWSYIAVAVTAASDIILLIATVVRLIDSLVGGFDALKTAGERDALAFFRRGRPVAILLPLDSDRVYLPYDVEMAAREHARRLKANQDVDAHESGATIRGAE